MQKRMAFILDLHCLFKSYLTNMKKLVLLPLLITTITVFATAQYNSVDITGRWRNTENNIEVEIYKTGKEYKAKVIWFDDSDDKSRPMNVRNDQKNPNELLRTRKIIGLQVMQGMVYNAAAAEWQDGRIYDASSGKEWNAKAWLTNDGSLKVRGFWHFEFIGQNMSFKKVQ